MVFGALAGSVLLGGGGFLASLLLPGVRDVTPQPFINLLGHWADFWMVVGAAPGLVAGGYLGSRALGMSPRARIALGAIGGAVLLAPVGGFGFLFVGLGSPEGIVHGLKNFVIGAIVGGMAGLVAGGHFGGRTAGSNREVS